MTTRLRSRLPVLVAGLVPILAGCPGTLLRSELVGIKQRIDIARENGAYLCAPRELALAEANYDFAKAELYYGNYFPARDHVDLAQKNANLAVEKSPRGVCVYSEHPPPPRAIPKIGDRDGDGVLDNVDKCPDQPGPKENQGCPDTDRDKDGIVDRLDKCPDEPEDKDGFEDEDGCPDPDNDKDGIPDVDDKCPNQPGPPENQGCPDTDRDKDGVVDRLDKCPDEPGPPPTGCPEPPRKFIVVTNDKIELKQKIHFATNKSKIFPDSFELLNEVADVLKQHPTMELRIEGHTDSRGKLKRNTKLSEDRAEAVRQYLIRAGAEEGRLTSKGFGPTVPIGDNKTAKGREQNRRTEFYIVKQ